MTDIVHPGTVLIAGRAARIIGLGTGGTDLLCPDIAWPLSETGGGTVEVNAGPGLRMHIAPSEGQPRNVAAPVIDMRFPEGGEGRIPVFAITGTNGKSTTARMLAHVVARAGRCVGLTSSNGIFVGGRRIASGDCAGPPKRGAGPGRADGGGGGPGMRARRHPARGAGL